MQLLQPMLLAIGFGRAAAREAQQKRRLERMLMDSGFSRSKARAFVSAYFKR